MAIKYTIKKEGDEVTIVKTGMKETFTLQDLNDIIKYNEKMKKETEDNLSLREAELQNIVGFYPKVLEMTDEELFRIAMYQDRKKDVADYKDKLKQFEEKLEEQYKIKELTNE